MNTTISPFRLSDDASNEVVYTTSMQDFDEVANHALRLLEEEDAGAVITFGDGEKWLLIYDETMGWQMDPLGPAPRNFLGPLDVNDLQPPVA